MAEVICASCGSRQEGGERLCGVCFTPFGERSRAKEPEVSYGVPTIPVDEVAEAASTREEVDCRFCGGMNEVGVPTCTTCGAAAPHTPMVVEVTIRATVSTTMRRHEGDQFDFGRGSSLDADMVSALNPYDYVSRRHAAVCLMRRRVEITDVSTNGTAVNGEQLARNVTRTFNLPVTVRLADECDVAIEVRR